MATVAASGMILSLIPAHNSHIFLPKPNMLFWSQTFIQFLILKKLGYRASWPCTFPSLQVLDRAVLGALQQPVGAEGVDGQKQDEHMILKYVIVL